MNAVCFLLPILLPAAPLLAQNALERRIASIAAEAQGRVSVACSLAGTGFRCDLNPHAHPPMQSVFKLPLAIAALDLIRHGKLSLDQPVRFRASDRILPETNSPLQDRFSAAEVDVPLRELLRLAVSLSDNVAADMVLRAIGGPAAVDAFFAAGGGFHLEDNEAALHRDPAAQYRNWWEPAAAAALLGRFDERSPLTPEHTRLLLGWMRDSPTGARRIKGELPPGAVVWHKTGTSSTADGLTPATNDVGLIGLPDGRRLAIAIFVTDSKADQATRERAIACIARAAYDAAVAAGE